MPTGFITQHIDVAQVVLYAFWIFFAGLILYIRREDKREGYPLESDRSHRAPGVPIIGFPAPPEQKRWKMPHGEADLVAPRGPEKRPEIRGVLDARKPLAGNPLVPVGNPLRQGVGPASFANRRDIPDRTVHGEPKIQPISVLPGYQIVGGDPDPRGMPVVAADRVVAGTVADLWIDRAEPRILYFQVALADNIGHARRRASADHADDQEHAQDTHDGPAYALVPAGLARVQARQNRLSVASLMAADFAFVPGVRAPDAITRLEEDKITAYFAGGHLFRGATTAAESA